MVQLDFVFFRSANVRLEAIDKRQVGPARLPRFRQGQGRRDASLMSPLRRTYSVFFLNDVYGLIS